MFPPHKSIQVFLLTTGRAPLKDRRPMGRSSALKFLHISGTPVGSDFWRRKGSGAQTGRKSWNRCVFGIQILYISGTPLGCDFCLRNSSGAHTGRKSRNRIFFCLKIIYISGTPLGSDFWLSPNGKKIMESICFCYHNPMHF